VEWALAGCSCHTLVTTRCLFGRLEQGQRVPVLNDSATSLSVISVRLRTAMSLTRIAVTDGACLIRRDAPSAREADGGTVSIVSTVSGGQ